MKRLSDIGVSTSLRLRPIMQGITDKNKAWYSLINKAADAGAKAISYEVGFYPQAIPKANKWKWEQLNKLSGRNFKQIYSSFGKLQACTRPSYLWTEEIMHRIKEVSVDRGLNIGVSDPVWKQLTEAGCCCGIMPDDPVFGNWEQENATNTLLIAMDKKGDGRLMYFKDINPPWSKDLPLAAMVNLGAGPKFVYDKKYLVWEDHLIKTWDNPSSQRSPMNYFQGALQIHKDEHGNTVRDSDGHIVYKYVGLKRHNLETGWNV